MVWMPGLPYLSQNSNIAGILQDYDVKPIWKKIYDNQLRRPDPFNF